ncbi:MAG: lipase family protein, partial [Methylocystis sp.]
MKVGVESVIVRCSDNDLELSFSGAGVMMTVTSAAPQVRATDLPILRAAYSDRTAALMATLARLAYDFPPQGSQPGPAPAIPAEFKSLGFDRITYFHNGLIDGWAYLAEGQDIIALVFRGTQSTQNWDTNFQVETINPPNTDAHLHVHKGFYNAFSKMADGKEGLRLAFEKVRDASQGTIPIYITGHSLGGALAQIATAVFGCDQIAACYTFGSPRVGNSYFDLWVKPPSYRVENYADIVPQVPVFAPQLPIPEFYRHSGDARYLPKRVVGSPFRYEPGLLVRAWQFLLGLGSVGNRDSSFQLVMIQALDEPIRFDRRPMGEDGAALSWQGERSRP